MKNEIQKYNTASPARARLVNSFKTSLLLAPFALTSAFAATDPAITAMAADAQGGVDAVKAGVVGLVGVVVVIGLIIWGSRHLKPKG